MPSIPTPLDQLGNCPFSFYPPILNIEHNEWIFRRATWNEIHVVNTKTADELSVPRYFVGTVSLVEEPVVIVGLLKELEYKAGAVIPVVRRVIEMPRAVNESPRPRIREQPPDRPAAVVGIRLESSDSRSRIFLWTVAAGLLACIPVAIVLRDGLIGARFPFSAAHRVELPFTANDNYHSIVLRLGPPAEDTRRFSRGVEYRRLWYPQHSFALILVDDHYTGARDAAGRIIHSVRPLENPR